jgi:hypothetical protein
VIGDAAERFDELVGMMLALPAVTPPDSSPGFGSSALRVNGKIFAMLVRGELVLKLPRMRVDKLVETAEGVRFDANKGTPMKEWFVVSATSASSWTSLAREAYEFVGSS